jgi:tetratricopeptide (TPR) repeat protein
MMERMNWTILRDAGKQASLERRFDEAEARLREAQHQADAEGAGDSARLALYPDMIQTLLSAGKAADARQAADEWLAVAERAMDVSDARFADVLMMAAAVICGVGDLKRGVPLFRRARKILEGTLDTWHPDVADCLRDHAAVLEDNDRYEEAIPLYRRALAIFEAEVGPDSPEVAETLTGLGNCLAMEDEYYAAKRYLRRALATSQHVFGADSREAARAAQDLAELHIEYDEFEEAMPLLHQALGVLEDIEGANGSAVGSCLSALSNLHRGMNQPELAFLHYRRAIAIWDTDAAYASLLPDAYDTFAELAALAGRADEAIAARKKADELRSGPR